MPSPAIATTRKIESPKEEKRQIETESKKATKDNYPEVGCSPWFALNFDLTLLLEFQRGFFYSIFSGGFSSAQRGEQFRNRKALLFLCSSTFRLL